MIVRAISVGIFEDKSIGNCSNGGISSRFDNVLIEHPRGWIEVDTENPPENFCKIVTRHLWGKDYMHIEPVAEPEHLGWMMGGCLCYSSDSRFHELTEYALALHDRQETQEHYDRLSR